jgi:hypothetical protein
MAPRALDAAIDRLYQLPLEEFTPARNALAKGAGGDAARIRALPKPPLAAWAVNQLYWRKVDVWNALLAAAENARGAHRALLAGRAGDVRAAGKVHDEAVDAALKATLALLADSGHPATDATRHTIGTTLRALPAGDSPGHLSRTLQPAGFEMVTGLTPAPPRGRSASAAPPPKAKVDAKALTRARQAAAVAARALRDAENAARRDEFERVRTAREETRAAEAAGTAREEATRAAADLERAEAAASAAARLRDAAATRALDAQKELSKARSRAESAEAEVKKIEKGGPRTP